MRDLGETGTLKFKAVLTLVWALLEVACIYLLLNRVGVRRLAGVGIVAFAAIVTFGFVGDLRLGANRVFLDNVIAPIATV